MTTIRIPLLIMVDLILIFEVCWYHLHHCKGKDPIGVLTSAQEKLSVFISVQ